MRTIALADLPGPGVAPGSKPPGTRARQAPGLQLGLGSFVVHAENHVCVLSFSQCDVQRRSGVGANSCW